MPTTKRVAILTGGGDVPGLNMCLKSLVYRLIETGYEPIGVRKGWEGLIAYNPDDPTTYSDHFIELTKNMVRPIDRTPGSYLHSSRLDPRHTPRRLIPPHLRDEKKDFQDLTSHIKNVFERLGYRGLIVVGDDDTLSYAAHLSAVGVPIVAVPKTIHNNIPGTDYTLGFSTGLARGVSFIHELRALAGSREQLVVIETFAAKSGYSTLLMGLLAGVDRVLIPEVPYNPEDLAFVAVQDQRQTPSNYAVILVCDGAHPVPEAVEKYGERIAVASVPELDAAAGVEHPARKPRRIPFLGRVSTTIDKISGDDEAWMSGERLVGSGMVAAQLLAHITQEEVFLQRLTYLLRTGAPDGQDLLGAVNFAFTAVELLDRGQFGRMAAFVKDRMWTDVDLSHLLSGSSTFDIDTWYDRNDYRPKLALIWSAGLTQQAI
jgi:ATP-dependent phosphofructokinase / diphosphate-dependent phosphofructokinase